MRLIYYPQYFSVTSLIRISLSQSTYRIMVEILNANDNFPVFEDRAELTVPLSEVRFSLSHLFFSFTQLIRHHVVLLKVSSC